MKIALLTAYALLAAAANWATATLGLVPIGLGLTVTAGTFAAGAVLLVRDALQMRAGRTWVLAAIALGTLLSVVTSTPALAVASGVAFAVSEMVDWSVFTPLRARSLALAVLVSSIVSAPVDTALFLWIAGFDLTPTALLGQFIVKTLMAALVAAYLAVRERRDVSVRG